MDDAPAKAAPPAGKRTPAQLFRTWFGATALVVCTISCHAAWNSSGWSSIAMLFCILPLAHLTLLLLGAVAAFVTRHYHPQAKLGSMIGLALGLSVLSWLIASAACIQST